MNVPVPQISKIPAMSIQQERISERIAEQVVDVPPQILARVDRLFREKGRASPAEVYHLAQEARKFEGEVNVKIEAKNGFEN